MSPRKKAAKPATIIDLSRYPKACPVEHHIVPRPYSIPEAVPHPVEPWIGDMPWWDYHRLEAVRSSEIRIAAERSLAHMKEAHDAPDDEGESTAMTKGRALHALLLETDTQWKRYARAPEWLTNRSRKADKEEWNRLVEEHGREFVLTAAEYDGVVGQANAILRRRLYTALLRQGMKELTVVWRDRETDVWCKARIDYLTKVGDTIAVLDLKGTRDARREKFEASISEFGYHFQGAHYLEGLHAHGIGVQDYCILASEWAAPYEPQLHRLSDHVLRLAETKRERIMEQIARAQETGVWPGYAEEVTTIGLRAWEMRALEAELQMEG